MTWKIKQNVVQAILESSRHTYPDEFIALLGGDEKEQLITELVILPAIFGSEHAMIRTDLLAMGDASVGSIHSHPDSSNRPSPEDLNTFGELGPIHFILGWPYSPDALQAYDHRGKKIPFQIIP